MDLPAPTITSPARAAVEDGPAFRLYPWHVDPALRELARDRVTRRISLRAMGVLVVLTWAGGAVVGREPDGDDLARVVVGDESLTTAVSELRRAPRATGSNDVVETAPRTGYRLRIPAVPVLRVVDSLQLTARHKVATPTDWLPGENMIILPALSDDEARAAFPAGWKAPRPYLRIVADPAA